MSEYWKSTPKYWCQYCSDYVRDTKLARAAHDTSGKHQGAVKRSLANLHRAATNEERERARARREIDRLNGIIPSAAADGKSHNAAAASSSSVTRSDTTTPQSRAAERKRQAEELAALGVALPEAFRGDLAMPGEWSVVRTEVVGEEKEEEKVGSRARGVHKRERTEEERETEEAVRGLEKTKRARRWGRDVDMGEASVGLDELLSGGLGLVVKKKKEDEDEEGLGKTEADGEGVKKEEEGVKQEHEEAGAGSVLADVPIAVPNKAEEPSVDASSVKIEDASKTGSEGADVPVVAFKKRKPKHIRQK